MGSGAVSDRMVEVLRILARKEEPVEWGTVWDSYSWADPSSPLAMTNFDRVTDALVRRKLVEMDADNLVTITEAGRATLRIREIWPNKRTYDRR